MTPQSSVAVEEDIATFFSLNLTFSWSDLIFQDLRFNMLKVGFNTIGWNGQKREPPPEISAYDYLRNVREGASVCKPNEIIKANLLTQHLMSNQFFTTNSRG